MVSASNFYSEDKGLFSRSLNSFLPSTAIVPIEEEKSQIPVEPVVSVGDVIAEGQIVAVGGGVNVHSPVPGTVSAIGGEQYANGKQGKAIRIKLGGKFSFVGKKRSRHDWRALGRDSLLQVIRMAGIVNTFKDMSTLFNEISTEERKVVFVRLFDDDPSRVVDSFVAENFSEKVIEGTAVIARACGAAAVVFAYEKQSAESRRIYRVSKDDGSPDQELFPGIAVLRVGVDGKHYPSGTALDLVFASRSASKALVKDNPDIAGCFEPDGFRDSSALFIDPQTALSAFEAAVEKVPVMGRFVHVTGDCLNSAAILNVKIGTTLGEVAEQCGGFKKKLSRIVVNGIVSGVCVGSLDVPVSKFVKSVEFIPSAEVRCQSIENCVRCGQCRKICPVNLWPGNIYRVFRNVEDDDIHDFDDSKTVIESARLCIECGLCNSVCPSRLPLKQMIALAKSESI